MPEPPPRQPPTERLARLAPDSLAALIRSDQRARWERGERVLVEDYLRRFPELAGTPAAVELIRSEWQLRKAKGEAHALGEYQNRFPELGPALVEFAELETAFAGGLLEIVRALPATVVAPPPSDDCAATNLAVRTPPVPVGLPSAGPPHNRCLKRVVWVKVDDQITCFQVVR